MKENASKAESEIVELDKIINQVREVNEECSVRNTLYCGDMVFHNMQVLRANIGCVRKCKPLLLLLRELDGNEAPEQY